MGGEGSLNSFSKLSPRYHLFDITLGGAQTGVGSNVFVYVYMYAHLNVLLPGCQAARTLAQERCTRALLKACSVRERSVMSSKAWRSVANNTP